MEITEEIRLAVDILKDKLAAHRGQHITGSVVGEILIKQANLRLKNLSSPTKITLSRFIELYLADTLVKTGPQGGDVLYFVGKPGETVPALPEYRYWIAFAKADEPNQLAVRENDQELIIVDPLEDLLGARLIPKITLSDLEEIKLEFIDHEIANGLNWFPDKGLAYPYWVAKMKAIENDRVKVWGNFRIDSLKKLFTKHLDQMGIVKIQKEILTRFLFQSQASKPKKTFGNPGIENPDNSISHAKIYSRQTHPAEFNLRNAIAGVMQNMSIEELRELKLPVGLLMDALQAQLKN